MKKLDSKSQVDEIKTDNKLAVHIGKLREISYFGQINEGL